MCLPRTRPPVTGALTNTCYKGCRRNPSKMHPAPHHRLHLPKAPSTQQGALSLGSYPIPLFQKSCTQEFVVREAGRRQDPGAGVLPQAPPLHPESQALSPWKVVPLWPQNEVRDGIQGHGDRDSAWGRAATHSPGRVKLEP